MSAAIEQPPATFNQYDPEYQGPDRYRILAEYRENEPPVAVDPLNRTWAFRYDDVYRMAVRSHGLEAMETDTAEKLGYPPGCPFHDWQAEVIISQNPPKHTRLRKATSYFGKHQLKPLEPAVRAAVHELIDGFPDDGEIEFAKDFAFSLPVGVIMRILKLPKADEHIIHEWSPAVIPGGIGPEFEGPTNAANAKMREYIESVMDERRKQPLEDDIISNLLVLERSGELTTGEIWANVLAMVNAGHETTTSALQLGLYTLLHNRDQMEELRADPSLVPNAANELLRYEPPLDHVVRRVNEPFAIHGLTLEPGTLLQLNLASANRDPRHFPDPDRFDVRRKNALQHLTFSGGIHRCLGASLAGLEVQTAVGILLERLETIELVREPVLAMNQVFRSFEELPLHITRRS